jgi:hypothetical protein
MQIAAQLLNYRQRSRRVFTQPLLQVIGNGAEILLPRADNHLVELLLERWIVCEWIFEHLARCPLDGSNEVVKHGH